MIHWQIGEVTELVSERYGMQEVRVRLPDGRMERALHDTSVHETLQTGDQVLLNTTAVHLNLGTGGYHFVHTVLPPGERSPKVQGHMMKLKYTSLQRAVLAAEEQRSPHHDVFLHHQSIDGTPVLIGELHSMLPIACTWLRSRRPDLRIAYVMSDGGALPIALSRHVAALKQMNWLQGTVTYGQAYGGDLETMNKFTALIAARHVLGADVIIVCMGPGIAGTGTPLGHTGTEAGELVNAAHRLGGIPIMMARVSGAEQRPRHYGLSHHLLANLQIITACPAILPLNRLMPDELLTVIEGQLHSIRQENIHRIEWLDTPSADQLEGVLRTYPLKISTMGRSSDDDPVFYMNVASAAEYAWRSLGS